MKKIVTLGATTLTALTLLGAAQPLAHASQIHVAPNQTHSKLTSVQTKADADVVSIPDEKLKNAIKDKLSIPQGVDTDDQLTEAKMATLTEVKFASKDITSLEGMQKSGVLTYLDVKGNHITDLTPLANTDGTKHFTDGNPYFNGQTVKETSQEAVDGAVSLPVQTLKNYDGSTPTITVQQNGKLENGTVSWERLPSTTTSVTYKWVGANTGANKFSGTVTVPVTWASAEDKAQADVNLLFKDNTRAELDTGVTVQKIETARKEVNALVDSDKKTELLGQIGDAYGMYFIVDAKSTQLGDPLGDKVRADGNMTTLYDFVEAATDFEADMTKTKTSNSAAGIYDHVRSGWSKAVLSAQSRVNAYVAGTDLSQAGLGSFSTDVANLNTAASAIQADQSDVNNDKVEVQYNYTVQAPGEPGWYGVVPSAVTLTDANRSTGQLANVELKDATQVGGKYIPYDGGKTVEVSVKSDNSYKLDDGKNDPLVDYKLDFVDGQGTHDVVQDNSEHKIGEMKAGTTTIVSHISLVGNATKSGKYVDNLFYHFSEK